MRPVASALAALLLLVVVAGGTAAGAAWLAARAGVDVLAPPSPGADASGTPAGGIDLPVADGPYAFLLSQDDGTPVRWSSCHPIRVVLSTAGAPPGGTELVRAALESVAAATGLDLVVEGQTSERASVDRPARQPERYGDGWAPVLVAWASGDSYEPLAGSRVGVAAPVAVDPPGREVSRYVTGSVVLETGWFERMLASPVDRRHATAIVKHELGHLVGLDHVADPLQLMSPTYQAVPDWSAGDRAGLAVAGSGPCLAELD